MSYSLRSYLLTLACVLAVGACAESPENADPEALNEQPRGDGGGAQDDDTDDDDGASDDDETPPKDAGAKRDASSTGTPPRDAGGSAPRDAGGGSSTDSGSNPLDDLLGDFIDLFNPPKDAGADAGKRDGG
jgi:hypothetical protein